MLIERKMIHDIVELIPESDISKVYAILNAYLLTDIEDDLTDVEEARMNAGFSQISKGEYITANNYLKKREIVGR